MKNCVNCKKDLPDSAMHCVYCGSRQPPAGAAAPPGGNAQTVMGFGSEELVKEMEQRGRLPNRPGQPGAPAQGQGGGVARTMFAAAGQSDQHAQPGAGPAGGGGVAQTVFATADQMGQKAQPVAGPAQGQGGGVAQTVFATADQMGQQAQPVAGGPGAGGPGAGAAKTMFAGSQSAQPAQPRPSGVHAGVSPQAAPGRPSAAQPSVAAPRDASGPVAKTMFASGGHAMPGQGAPQAGMPGSGVPMAAPHGPSGAVGQPAPGQPAPGQPDQGGVARTMFASGGHAMPGQGVPQAGAPVPGAADASGPVAKTMFAAAGQGAPAPGVPQGAPRAPSGAVQGGSPSGEVAKTVFAMDLQSGGGTSDAMAQTVMAGPGGVPPGGAPPPQARPSGVHAVGQPPGGPGMGQPPGGPGMGPPPGGPGMGPPPAAPAAHPAGGHGAAPAAHPAGGHGHAHPEPAPGGPVQYANQPRVHTAHVAQMPRPPYLASQTAARMEPWSHALPVLMGVFGALLVACFALPWTVGETSWSWTVFGVANAPWQAKLRPLLLISTGFLALVMALLPLATQMRGIAAMSLGLIPWVLGAFVLTGEVEVHAALQVVGVLTLVPGLILRSTHRDAMTARVITTIGVACVVLALVIPAGDQVPLVGMFERLGSVPGKAKLGAVVDIVPVVLAAVALLVWLPPPSTAGALVLAWLFIAWPMVHTVVHNFILKPDGVAFGAYLKQGLYPMLYSPLADMAWLAMLGFGAATVVGSAIARR